MRKYINYLNEQMKYWKNKLSENGKNKYYTRMWIEQMYETFREKIEKEKREK